MTANSMGRRTVLVWRLKLAHQWSVGVLATLPRYTIQLLRVDLRLTEHSGTGDRRSEITEMRSTWAAAAAVLHNALAAATAGSDRSTLGR